MLDSHPELHHDKHWDEVFYKQALIRTPSKKDQEEKEKKDDDPNDVSPEDKDKADFEDIVVSP